MGLKISPKIQNNNNNKKQQQQQKPKGLGTNLSGIWTVTSTKVMWFFF